MIEIRDPWNFQRERIELGYLLAPPLSSSHADSLNLTGLHPKMLAVGVAKYK